MNRFRTFVTIAALAALVAGGSGAAWIVQPGDSLWAIARATDTTVADLVALNELRDPDLIRPGQELSLPGSGAGSGSEDGEAVSEGDAVADAPPEEDGEPAASTTYRIQPGDTLFAIARRHGTTVSALARLNAITDPDVVRVGQVLTVADDASSPSGPATGSSPNTPSQAEVGPLLHRTARDHGMDPALIKAVAWQESRWRNHVVSSAGARGIMQVMPATGQWISRNLAGRTLDLNDPVDNVLAGVLYLDHLQRITAGNERRMLASYFQGPNAVARGGISPAGHRYVDSVHNHRARFR